MLLAAEEMPSYVSYTLWKMTKEGSEEYILKLPLLHSEQLRSLYNLSTDY